MPDSSRPMVPPMCMRHELSAAMGADKVRNAESTGADVLCAADNSCLMHIGGTMARLSTDMRPVHIAEILAGTEEESAA